MTPNSRTEEQSMLLRSEPGIADYHILAIAKARYIHHLGQKGTDTENAGKGLSAKINGNTLTQ